MFILELSLKEVGERGTIEFQGKAGEMLPSIQPGKSRLIGSK